MGLGQKIKEALHHDEPANKSYETNKPPGAFPSDSTTTGTTGTTGTNTSSRTGGYTGGATSGSGLTGNTHGGATGDIAGTGKTTHRPTDSGVDVAHRKNVTDEYNRTGERGTTQDPYWGSLGRESHGVTGSNARTGYDDPSGTHGPHGNRAANAADPRVDSDRDHRGAPGTGLTGTHGTTGSSGLTGSNARTGYDDPSGTHGPHGNRAGNLADPRVDSDRDHRGAPGTGFAGTHGTTGSSGLAGSNVTTGYDDPSGTHGPHGNRAANLADPRVDSDRDHRGAPGGLTGANKDLPLRPNEQYGSSYERTSGNGPQAVGGGHYNPNVSAGGHHDPTSGVDRSIEGRDFTHTGGHGGAGNQQYGISNPVSNPNLAGAHSNDPYDTRMRDRDMGRDRTGHGLAGGVAGAGLGVAASEAARRHHHDDIRDSGYGGNNNNNNDTGLNTGGNFNSSTNTRGDLGGVGNSPTTRGNIGGTDDYSRTGGGLTGNEPGVPNSSMLDPYTKSQSGGVGLIGRNGSPPWNQGPTSGPNTSSTGPSHYGPAHEGAKVMHTCTHCGNDNDISQYFKKDAVYRMGR